LNVSTILLWLLALLLSAYAWQRHDGSLKQGARQGWGTLRRVFPLLLAAFALVGYIEVLAPQELIQAWVGPQSGWGGLLVAELGGMLLPGGPYAVFPLISALYRAGAGIGPAVTLIAAWAATAFIAVSFELPFMGWRFTAVRWGLSLPFPIIAGLAVRLVIGSA
jgi:uncharacterized membrane protein YraQ (UPF0718 family)